MRTHRMHHRHSGPSLGMIFLGLALFWLFGWKLFFLVPLFMMMGFWGWSRPAYVHADDSWNGEKPKRKRDEFYVEDDTTFV